MDLGLRKALLNLTYLILATSAVLLFLAYGLPAVVEVARADLEQAAAEREAEGPPALKLPSTVLLNRGLDGSCALVRGGEPRFHYRGFMEDDLVDVPYTCESKGSVWIQFRFFGDGSTNFLMWFPRVEE